PSFIPTSRPRARSLFPSRAAVKLPECPSAPRPAENPPMPDFTYADIAGMIDHSLLQPVLTDAEMEQGCRLAREYQVASVCIKPYGVKLAVQILSSSRVAVCTVIGFPHGGHVTAIKRAEAEQAMADGARELDMVVNIGKVLTSDWDY